MTPSRDHHPLVTHLFRHEAGRLSSWLTCLLGFDRLEEAEDIVQDTMLQALHSWPFQGTPDNPRAWLYKVARNRAMDILRREKRFPHDRHLELDRHPDFSADTPSFPEDEITDSQLRMLFACCHPALTIESQVAMCLKVLCGLSVREIAAAFLTAPDTVEKRLYRAREKLRAAGIRLEVPIGPQLPERLEAVHRSIYLLFNEGYNSHQPEELIRGDLCEEALRLGLLLTQNPLTDSPAGNALLALMCFQVARFEARIDAAGAIVLLPDQDRSRWNRDLIRQGQHYLHRSADGHTLSSYHLEAGIAMLHCQAASYEATDWPTVLQYYDLLMSRYPTPVVALNRSVALGKVEGPEAALAEVINLTELDAHPYYHAILGDLYEQMQQFEPACQHYRRARQLTPSVAEKALLSRKLAGCGQ